MRPLKKRVNNNVSIQTHYIKGYGMSIRDGTAQFKYTYSLDTEMNLVKSNQ